MKQYTKPTIAIAAATGSSAVSTCIEKVDVKLIVDIIGYPVPDNQLSNTFAAHESCTIKLPVDFYCKFTSVELGALQAFIS